MDERDDEKRPTGTEPDAPSSRRPRDLTTPAPSDEGAAEDTGDAIGNDNIREGRVGGLMGGPRQSQGQGQGG